MFSNLFDYDVVRTSQQAIGFYIIHLIIIMVLGGVFAGVLGSFLQLGATPFETGVIIGSVWAVIACGGLAIKVLSTRDRDGLSVMLTIAAFVLAVLGGGLLGLLPVAYLTTRGPQAVDGDVMTDGGASASVVGAEAPAENQTAPQGEASNTSHDTNQ